MSDFTESFNLLWLIIPLVSGFVGWFTNWIAIKAMLYPKKFIGIKPFSGLPGIGWQGVIPANIEKLSKCFSELIANKLVNTSELISSIKDDPEMLAEATEEITEKVVENFATELAPDKWEKASDKLRDYIRGVIDESVREMSMQMVDDIAERADEFFDVDSIVCEVMNKNPSILGDVLLSSAGPEFKFIERSGLWFGLGLGILQLALWVAFPSWWLLPLAGFFVGYITNFLALKLIFEPRQPINILGFEYQGLFIKRQMEFALSFAEVVSEKVLHIQSVLDQMNAPNKREPIMAMVNERVDASMTRYEKDPMVMMMISQDKLSEAREDLQSRIDNDDFDRDAMMQKLQGHHASKRQKAQLLQQIRNNLAGMDADEFGLVLRPVFQEDEWKLIVAGGALGAIAGLLQVLFIFG